MEPSLRSDGDGSLTQRELADLLGLQWSRRSAATETVAGSQPD
jgi:hypothetical protein